MTSSPVLSRAFYQQPTLTVARQLLGCLLVRREADGSLISGWIAETEAYIGQEDQACHARHGRTQRNESMWGQAGHSYVYFTYGMHWLLNVVTEQDGYPAAVLLRAVVPEQGLDIIERRRGHQPAKAWTDGPAKLCQAFNIDGDQDGLDLCRSNSPLQIQPGLEIPDKVVTRGPRVGLNKVPEPWLSKPWRFLVDQETITQLSEGDVTQ